MEFTLVYRGRLPSNGTLKDKQQIRRELHRQIKVLWAQIPLVEQPPDRLKESPPPGEISVVQRVGDFRMACIVTQRLDLVADIDVTMLRPGALGGIIARGGDIDNRLKTLFDALRMPKSADELPPGDKPLDGETPVFHCLLEDDSLITDVRVHTDRLLDSANLSEVLLLIRVRTKQTRATWANIGL